MNAIYEEGKKAYTAEERADMWLELQSASFDVMQLQRLVLEELLTADSEEGELATVRRDLALAADPRVIAKRAEVDAVLRAWEIVNHLTPRPVSMAFDEPGR